MRRRSAVIVHANEFEWDAIRQALSATPGATVVAEAKTTEEAIDIASSHKPDVVLASTVLEGTSSHPALLAIQTIHSPVSSLTLFAKQIDADEIRCFGRLRLTGFFLWSEMSGKETVKCALASILTGDLLSGTTTIAREYAGRRPWGPRDTWHGIALTDREKLVLQRLAQGHKHADIARLEGMSVRTVERTISGLESKLGATSLFTLAMQATLLGIIPNDGGTNLPSS